MEPAQVRQTGARFLLVAACLTVVVAGLKAAAGLVLPFLIAAFLTLISLPLLNGLQSRRVPMPIAVVLTILAALSPIVLIAIVVGGSLADFSVQIPRYQASLRLMVGDLAEWLRSYGFHVPDEWTQSVLNPEEAFAMVKRTLRGVAVLLSNLVLVLLTIIFLLSEAAGLPAKFMAAFGRTPRSERFANIKRDVQHYLVIKTSVSLAVGFLIATGMWIIGVDFPLLWGVLAFLLHYIPALGSFIAALPAALLALVQIDLSHAVAVCLVFLAVNMCLGNLLEPYLMGRGLGLSTLVVFLSMLFWGWVWGPVGMLIAAPMTMIVKIMLENTEDLRWLAVLLGPHPKSDGDSS